jgi:tetratricopeptide (TPR) repeat protein
MTVVGHIEQLRRSACYQNARDLSCLTCHDPHAKETPKDRVALYRQKCLDCHANKGCKLPEADRRKKDAADNCTTCHMPRGDTDIPHIAFTHHRIGKHPVPPPPDTWRLPDLVPTDDVSRLPALDQKRNLGLAYLHVSEEAGGRSKAQEYRDRARELLEVVHAANLRDGPTLSGLALIRHAGGDYAQARALAAQAMASGDLIGPDRARTLLVLADCEIRERQFDAALTALQELTRLRRNSEDWRLMGVCHLAQNQPRQSLAPLEHALAIRPFRHDIHAMLADAYDQLGDAPRAREHRATADWLEKHAQE